jgi:hypothetical protein
MTLDLLERCRGDALSFPDAASAKLYRLAMQKQWRVDADVDWREFDLRRLPPSIRRAMATVYSQVRFIEASGLVHVAGLLERTEEPWARLMLSLQVADESRHIEFFSKALAMLDMDAAPSAHLLALCRELDDAATVEEGLLGTQIIMESCAHALFHDAARLTRLARARAIAMPGSAGALRFVDCMAKLIGGDEARHVAFGVMQLRRKWVGLPPSRREHLQKCAVRWTGLLDAALLDIAPALGTLGLDAARMTAHAARTRHRQLLAVGWAP